MTLAPDSFRMCISMIVNRQMEREQGEYERNQSIRAVALVLLAVCMPPLAAEAQEPCTHKYLEYWTEFKDGEYTARDACSHEVSGYPVTHTLCHYCGAETVETGDEKRTKLLSHSFQDGACKDCGYVNPCPHESVHDYEWFLDIKNGVEYSDITEETHIQTGQAAMYRGCRTCGELWTEPLEHEKVFVCGHSYAHEVCRCGFKDPCPILR